MNPISESYQTPLQSNATNRSKNVEEDTPTPHNILDFDNRLPTGSVDLNQLALIQSLARHSGAGDPTASRQARLELIQLAGCDQNEPVDLISIDPKHTARLNAILMDVRRPGEKPPLLTIQGDGFCGWRSAMLSFLLTGEERELVDALKRLEIDPQIIERLELTIPIAHQHYENVLCKSSPEQVAMKLRYPYEEKIHEGSTQLEQDLRVIVEKYLQHRGDNQKSVDRYINQGQHATSDLLIDFSKYLGQPLIVEGSAQCEIHMPCGDYANSFRNRLKEQHPIALSVCSLHHDNEHFDLFLPKVLQLQKQLYTQDNGSGWVSDRDIELYRNSERPKFVSCNNESDARPLYRAPLHDDLRQSHQEIRIFSGQDGQAGWLMSSWFAVLREADPQLLSTVLARLSLPEDKISQLTQLLASLAEALRNDPIKALASEPGSNQKYHLVSPGDDLELNHWGFTKTEQQLVELTNHLFTLNDVVCKASSFDGAIFSGDISSVTMENFLSRSGVDHSYESFELKFKQDDLFKEERIQRYKNALSEVDCVYSAGISSALMELFKVGTHIEYEKLSTSSLEKPNHKVICSNTASTEEFIHAFEPSIRGHDTLRAISTHEDSQPMIIDYLANKTVVSLKSNSSQSPVDDHWNHNAQGSFSTGVVLIPKLHSIDHNRIIQKVVKGGTKFSADSVEMLKNCYQNYLDQERNAARIDPSNYLECIHNSSYSNAYCERLYETILRDFIVPANKKNGSYVKDLPNLEEILKAAGVEKSESPVLKHSLNSISELFSLLKGEQARMGNDETVTVRNEVHRCFNEMASLLSDLNLLAKETIDQNTQEIIDNKFRELSLKKLETSNKMYRLFCSIDDDEMSKLFDYFGGDNVYDEIYIELNYLISPEASAMIFSGANPMEFYAMQPELLEALGLTPFEKLSDLIISPLPVIAPEEQTSIENNNPLMNSDILSDMENGLIGTTKNEDSVARNSTRETVESSKIGETMSLSSDSLSYASKDSISTNEIDPMDWEFIDEALSIKPTTSGSEYLAEADTFDQPKKRSSIILDRFRQIIKDGWDYLFNRTSHLRTNRSNEISPTSHIIPSTHIRKAVVGENPTEIKQINAVFDHTKSDPVSHIFQFVSSNRFNDDKRRESTFYGMAEKVINQEANSLGTSIPQHQIKSIEKIRSNSNAPIETIRVSYEIGDHERGELKENTLYLTLAGYSLKQGKLSTDDIVESYTILCEISDNIIKHDADESLMFFSKGGIGRSAALMVLNEVMNIHRENPITGLEMLYTTVNTVIEAGRSARGVNFIHNKPQYDALQEAAYRLIFE